MPKKDKLSFNFKDRVKDNVCDLSLTALTEVPVCRIASLKFVTVLDLSNNRLTVLGNNFMYLTRLVKIDLSRNQIKYLPENFGILHNLRHLVLYDNLIENLPLSFGNMTSLNYLDLQRNPLSVTFVNVVGSCVSTNDCFEAAKNTVKFLSELQTEIANKKLEYIKPPKYSRQKFQHKKRQSEVDFDNTNALPAPNTANNEVVKYKKKPTAERKSKHKSKSKSKKHHTRKNQKVAVNNNVAAKDVSTQATEPGVVIEEIEREDSLPGTSFNNLTIRKSICYLIILSIINFVFICILAYQQPEILVALYQQIIVIGLSSKFNFFK